MASVSSHNGSSHPSPYDFDSNGDTDESWQYIDYSSSGSAPGSVGFLPSPASGSLNGFALIGHHRATPTTNSQHSMSPVPPPLGDGEQPFLPPATSLPMSDAMDAGEFAMTTTSGFMADGIFMTPQEYLFAPDALSQWRPDALDFSASTSEFQMDAMSHQQHMQQSQAQQEQLAAAPSLGLEDFQQFQLEGTFVQWDPHGAGAASPGEGPSMNMAKYMTSPSQHSIGSSSPRSTMSVKSEGSGKTSPIAIRKVNAGRVGKVKTEQTGKFHIVTPNSINASAGRPNPYECFEAMRTTQRGRKGPLANTTKEDALQVRRRGACFCCRSRKVKCDTERPCKHCKKLMVQVPQVVCWQFQDFLTMLFPDFISAHLKKDEMTKFLRDNVDGFLIGGAAQPCSVKLFSGPRFSTTLDIQAKFFTAKTCDVLQHWHLNSGNDGVRLDSNGSAPIGLDIAGGQKDEVRKKVKAYVRQLIEEPAFPEQVTDSLRSTKLPTKILAIAQTYAQKTDCPMVKKALSIYAMHYVMTRHLCLTKDTVRALQPSGLVPQNSPWVTPRVLARQIKSLVDEICMREMQQLFELFTKALKPKYRKEWAPSLAAFLVLCLYMEAVETTTDNFVISQNAVNKKNNDPPSFKRSFALDMCREVENMPFKQYAYQFHHIYQTHSRDPNTKPFNPLFDGSFAAQSELDGPAIELVAQLQDLYQGEDCK